MIEDVGGLSSAPGPRPHVRRSTNAYTGCCSSGESWTEGLYIVVPPILVTQEECIVTSSYEAAPPARPTYDSGAPQPAAPQPPPQQHHAAPMPGPHQVSFPFFMWFRTSCVELYILLTRCSSHSLSSSSSISKATSSNLCIISREHSTTILLPHNIIRW